VYVWRVFCQEHLNKFGAGDGKTRPQDGSKSFILLTYHQSRTFPVLRGQHLYIRPIESGDTAAIQRLAAAVTLPSPATGLVGKLLGETVSFALFELAGPGTLRIEMLFVAPELRRKRIGSAMMAELEQLARSMDCHLLQVSHRCEGRGFFLRLGFAGDQDMLEKVL